jgi:hypothetical protein
MNTAELIVGKKYFLSLKEGIFTGTCAGLTSKGGVFEIPAQSKGSISYNEAILELSNSAVLCEVGKQSKATKPKSALEDIAADVIVNKIWKEQYQAPAPPPPVKLAPVIKEVGKKTIDKLAHSAHALLQGDWIREKKVK